MPHRLNNLINTKNCYRTIDGFVRRKKKHYKNGVIVGRRNREKKEERQIEREICGKRPEWVIVRVWEERKNERRRRSEIVYCEKCWMSERKYFFPRLEEDNIYRSYALCVREIVFQFFFFFLENNLYKISLIFIWVFCWPFFLC